MIIGITGSFGTGKTTVAIMFGRHGFKVINVVKVFRGIYIKNKSLKNKIKKEFGTINRNKLKKIVFNDSNKLKKLNKITHPVIIREIKNKIDAIIRSSNKKFPTIKISNNKKIINKHLIINKKVIGIKNNKNSIIGKNNIGTKNNVKIVLDVPLLIEAQMQGMVDKIIVVKCNEKIQIKRLLKKGRHTKEEIKNIIKSQMPIEKKLKYADFVVDNSGTLKEAERQIERTIANLDD
ncbi:MAG: dephospho-CoA kinase [Nanoarchaeota archaeon]|nr:dephospho-CoA kinase [Nanoarchaeota archaeon]